MIETQTFSKQYTADGEQTQWAVDFPYLSASDIHLFIIANDIKTEIDKAYFYFDTTTNIITYPLSGDPVPAGDKVYLERQTPITQEEDSSIQNFKSNDVERIADKLTMISQEVKRNAESALRIVDDSLSNVSENPVQNKVITTQINLINTNKEDSTNKVTSISGSSTDSQYPSAKAVNTELDKKQPKTLSEAIIVGDTTQTTVEGALNAINNISKSGHQIGEVFYSQSKLAADNKGSLPLFTGETISNADEVYPDFYSWVNSHSELQISSADYTTALSTYGECPKYVIDTVNKTIRLPLLKNYIKNANTADGVTQASAGLPNITGDFNAQQNNYGNWAGMASGAFQYGSSYPGKINYNEGATSEGFRFDASNSNDIYGNSDTVTPAHTTLFPWVCAYNAAVEASVAQAAEFQQALTGKVDLASGVLQANVDYVVSTQLPTAENNYSWNRVYKSGWVEQGGIATAGVQVQFVKEFADTNYSISGIPDGGNNAQSATTISCYNKTTTSIYFSTANNATNVIWEAKGLKVS